MSEQGKSWPFFITAFTPDGFCSLAEKTLVDSKHLFVLLGGSRQIKTRVLERVGKALVEKGQSVEWLRSPLHSDLLEGLIVPTWQVAVVDGPACAVADINCKVTKIDLDTCCDLHGLRARRDETESLKVEIKTQLEQAMDISQQVRRFHRQIEVHYGHGMDFGRANAKAAVLLDRIFENVEKRAEEPKIRYFFTAAWIPDVQTTVDLRPRSTRDCRTRYIIKGRPGTGKSTLAEKIAEAAQKRGYDTDLYICSFDMNSLDGVVIPALSTAVLDGTPTHALEPERAGDEIVDMLECVDLDQVDFQAIQALTEERSAMGANVQACLLAARQAIERLESLYAEITNDTAVEQASSELAAKIFSECQFV